MGWTTCRSRDTRGLCQSCTMLAEGAGEPQNPTWAEARRRVGCSSCCCLGPHRGPSRALSPGDGEMMAGKPPPSPACEVLPEVSPPRLSDVRLYVPWLSAICCSQGSGKMVGGHLCGRSGCNVFFPFEAVSISGGMRGSSFYI